MLQTRKVQFESVGSTGRQCERLRPSAPGATLLLLGAGFSAAFRLAQAEAGRRAVLM